jgi:hypothetical protein
MNQSYAVTPAAENNWWGSAGGRDSEKSSGSVDNDPWPTMAPGSTPFPAPPREGGDEEELRAGAVGVPRVLRGCGEPEE